MMKKKAARKKAAPKKPSKKTHSPRKKIMPEHYFMLIDGSVIKSLRELGDAIEEMSEDTFYHHVSEMKNDFHNWVKDVFKEMELAEKLLEAETKDRHLIEVLKFLVKRKR